MSLLISILLLVFLIAFAIVILYAILCALLGDDRANNLFIRNRLFTCRERHCKRLYRYYQTTAKSKNMRYCPHCGDWVISSSNGKTKEEKWMRTHADCPRLNLIEYIGFEIMVYKIKKNKKTVEDVEFFERYNARKPNTEWLNNITKSKK